MEYERAYNIAWAVKSLLIPHCHQVEIAGSIRRKKAEVKDIEIVAIPNPYETGLFESGIATIVNMWDKVKGYLPCKYTQRMLPEGIKLDLFFATPENWGLIYAMRTGSAEYSHKVLGSAWKAAGYTSVGGILTHDGVPVPTRSEEELFELIGVDWVEPEFREYHG